MSSSQRYMRRGMTILEVLVAMAVLAVGLMAVISAIMSTSELSLANQEELLAVNVVRQKLAEIKDTPFISIFSQYGPGTPNATVDVSSLQAGTLQNGVLNIVFPVNAAGRLDETVVDAELGMPQDLNGNGVSTDTDVSSTYTVLPVRIHVQWTSRTGARELSLNTMLTKLK
ncbi:MAG TPA: prepilin-type N-terminal cleavage/methylation domain-containing protein [Planctomycetota bacterium]|nr:prepilin-type N-terminal cleavage/methylation domain-containing protein [Planctomycetota bacterium]